MDNKSHNPTYEQLLAALNEVYHSYVEEFGPECFAEPTWPNWRFQIAIEDARILSGNPLPVVVEDNRE